MSGSLSDVTGRALAEVERRKIELALKEVAGDRARAAETLGLQLRVLAIKMKEYGLG
jgi:DNA-binding NtrC family response regulator